MIEQAEALAERLAREAGDDLVAQIARAYQLALGCDPTARELDIATAFFHQQQRAFEQTRSRLTFYPDVPFTLHGYYRDRLDPSQFLIGPDDGWRYLRGRWRGESVVLERSPAALWEASQFADGVIDARVTLHNAAQFGSIIVRGKPHGDVVHGYEVMLSAQDQLVSLTRFGDAVDELASQPYQITADQAHKVRIEAVGPRIRVWINDSDAPVLDVVDDNAIERAGQTGVRAWGAAVSVDDLTITPSGEQPVAAADVQELAAPSQRALQSLCLVILNLNEMVHID